VNQDSSTHSRGSCTWISERRGNPSWSDKDYPESFRGGIVRFITKNDDICDELDVDLAFPAEENLSNETAQPGPLAEGAAAAA
jgi:hypothetical protein